MEFNIWSWQIFIFLTSILIYIYVKWEANFFKNKGIKNVPYDFPLMGNLFKSLTQKEHFMYSINRIYNAFPDQKYVGFMQLNKPLYMLRDLDLIKKIAIKDFDQFLNHQNVLDEEIDPLFGGNLFSLRGDKWRDMRSTLSPAFTSFKMKNMFQFVVDISKQMTDYYLEKIKDDTLFTKNGYVEIEMKDAFSRYTNDVIATSAFGIKVNSLVDRDNSFYSMGKNASDLSGILILKFFLFSAFPKLMKMTGLKIFSSKTNEFFRRLVLDSIAQREEKNIIRHDMIQLLMDTRKGKFNHDNDNEEKDTGFAIVEESHVGKQSVKRKWSDDDLVAQAVVFFIAGFETTSTMLCFLTYQLAICPDIQKKLQEEIDLVIAEGSDYLDYNVLAKMKYMDMVISETLRLWPPIVVTDRECLKPYKLQSPGVIGKEYTLKVGEVIWIPIYAIQHDPKYFPNPEKFDPERFSDENKSKINPQSFMPFGIGPRSCIGSRFALMEIKAVIFHLLTKFDFVETSKTKNSIQFKTNTLNLHSKNGFWIGLRSRS